MKQQRYYSLDVFRGATVALMILVNNPGSWGHIFSPLGHASWHGCTPTDLVFPFFLFAVGNAMSFVMPKKYDASSLPMPNDTSIHIHTDAAHYAAVISFGGYATDEKIKSHVAQLKKSIQDRHIKIVGPYQFLGYNPPYQVVGRKNEIVIPIEWKE